MVGREKKKSIELFFKDIFEKYPNANLSITYSEYEKELEKNLDLEKILSYLKKLEKNNTLLLSFYVREMEGKQIEKKISLEPKKCKGFQYRYSLEGWGLISLQLKKLDSTYKVTCGGNSQKRAEKWFDTYPQLGDPKFWHWQVVESCRRAINRMIKKHELN